MDRRVYIDYIDHDRRGCPGSCYEHNTSVRWYWVVWMTTDRSKVTTFSSLIVTAVEY